MRSKRSGNFKSLAAAMALLLAAMPALGENIRLKAKIAAEPLQDIRLGDIATISGGDAQQDEELAGMVILSGLQRPQKVKAESVLMAVMAQRGTGGLGALQISGAAECEVTLKTTAPGIAANIAVAPVQAAAAPETKAPANPAPATQAAAAPGAAAVTAAAAPAPAEADHGTLRQSMIAALKKAINLPEGEYEIRIDSNNIALDRVVDAGRQWICAPSGKTLLGTVLVESQLVQGTKILERLSISTTVLRRQMVVVATRRIGRGEIVTAADVRTEAKMQDRAVPTFFGSMAAVVDLEAQRDVQSGEIADQHDFKPSIMARKGQLVTVVYISGSLQVQITGRAMQDAQRNDRIDIRNDSTGQQYSAVMIAKGIGAAGGTLTEDQQKKLVEALQ